MSRLFQTKIDFTIEIIVNQKPSDIHSQLIYILVFTNLISSIRRGSSFTLRWPQFNSDMARRFCSCIFFLFVCLFVSFVSTTFYCQKSWQMVFTIWRNQRSVVWNDNNSLTWCNIDRTPFHEMKLPIWSCWKRFISDTFRWDETITLPNAK
jgi:hypothetical protein